MWLVRVARRLQVPVAASGNIRKARPHRDELGRGTRVAPIVPKVDFSCVGERSGLPALARPCIVVAGMEARVRAANCTGAACRGRKCAWSPCRVFGTPAKRELALARMRDAGLQIVSAKWLPSGGWSAPAPTFREVRLLR